MQKAKSQRLGKLVKQNNSAYKTLKFFVTFNLISSTVRHNMCPKVWWFIIDGFTFLLEEILASRLRRSGHSAKANEHIYKPWQNALAAIHVGPSRIINSGQRFIDGSEQQEKNCLDEFRVRIKNEDSMGWSSIMSLSMKNTIMMIDGWFQVATFYDTPASLEF